MANKVNATPGAIQLMEQNQLDASKVKGSGKDGMILKGDVEKYLASKEDSKTAKAELDKAQKDVAAENAKKAKANQSQKAAENKRKKEAEKKKKEQEKKRAEEKAAREEAKAKKAAEREARKKEREEAAEKAIADKKAKDETAFSQFQKIETRTETVALEVIAPWDAAGAESRTAQSIKHLGAVTAVSLRELPEESPLREEGFEYEVVDGSRRLTDYVNQGIEETPAVIFPAETGDKEFHAARFLTNLARSQNMVHEAESMKAVMDATGWTQSDLADYSGIPLPTISKTLKVLELDEFWLNAVREGKIKGTVAFELANLTTEQLEKAKAILEETGTVKIKDVRDIRSVDKGEQVGSLNGEAFTDGKGKYQKPLETPEARFEQAAKELYGAGMDRDELIAILERVEAIIEEEAEEAGAEA